MHGAGSRLEGKEWLTAAAFAAIAGIGERAARKALARAFEGRPWRGKVLIVRKVPSRGGAAGWAFEVLAESVPGDAEGGLPTVPAASPTTAVPDAPVPAVPKRAAPQPSPSCAGALQRYEIIRPVLQHAPGSAERGRAIREAAGRAGVREQRIREWIAAYRAGGIAALKRRPREDRGRRKHTISAAWDSWSADVQLSDATKAQIAADLERYVRSLWRSSTELGGRRIALLASDRLVELTEEAGFEGDARRLKAICKLSLRFVRRSSHYRAVAIHDQDAKQWHDKHRPRIRRTREGCLPMGVVFGDVHHQDVLLPRADGSTFTAKLVAFLDWANNRIFVHPVFLAKGESVRQEHVIEAFICMTQDSGWGVPEILYLDNGKEYGCLDRMADALQLVSEMRALDDAAGLVPAALQRPHPIVKATPYNAAAKPIEPAFKVLEQGFFSLLQGWIGGDRMAKKTANVGREPIPYLHGEAAFLTDLQRCLAAYHASPQTGALDGLTPNEAFNAAVDAGWRRMDIARGALLAAFGQDEFRTVRQGGFSYDGRIYTHDAIQELPAGTRLHLRIPPFRDQHGIPVMDGRGGLRCMAAVDRRYDVLDPDVLRVIFSRPVGRTIRQGRISYDGALYTAPALWPLPADTKVEIRVPLIGDRRELCVLDSRGEFLCMAEPEIPYDALDPEGAREAARRRRVAEAAYRDMNQEIDPVDMEARMADVVSREEPAPIPERGNVIGMGERLERIAREIERSPAERQTIEATKAAREERRREQTRRDQDEFLSAVRGSALRPAVAADDSDWSNEDRHAIDALLKRQKASG